MLKTPRSRFAARTLVVAAASYVVSSGAAGGDFADWGSFGWGLAGAVAYAVVGLLTPTEPFVGIRPAEPVEVPADSSTPTP